MSSKRMIDINGVKIEVDLSTARKIDQFKVGDNVKVLRKHYSDTYNVYPGVIIEFVNFKEQPTIVIAMVKEDYNNIELEFVNYNSATQDMEITLALDHELKLDKYKVLDRFTLRIEKLQHDIDELEHKRDYFLKYFNRFFVKEE